MQCGICIPTRNQAEFVSDALRSAFSQTLAPIDVVVSDDAGTDNTPAVVEEFRATLSPELRSRLRYERSSAPLGIGGNFDRAVRLAKGDFVVKLDSDDMLEPDFVKKLGGQLDAHPQAGWAHCNVWNIQPNKRPIGLAHTRKQSGFYAAAGVLPAYLRHNDTCHCVLIRKSAYLEVSGYRPEMKTCEDWLLWLEMLFAGWGYVFEAQPLARMRKYEARPELMTRRRQAFLESAQFMAPRVERLCDEKVIPEMSPGSAKTCFRASLARLCVSSGCDEADPQVRQALFTTACDVYPSLKNLLWRDLGSSLPANVTRLFVNFQGLPRRCVRWIIQKL